MNEQASQHSNNFNLLRIYLSISVLMYHVFALSNAFQLRFLSRYFNADTAVEAFFIISGYLVMKSYCRINNFKKYITKRIKRIYPAYFVIIIASVCLGGIATSLDAQSYIQHPDTVKYLAYNLLFLNFLQPSLPGVFVNNIFTAVNGSLWSLKVEVCFYLLVPIIAFLIKKFNYHVVCIALFIASVIYCFACKQLYMVQQKEVFLFLSRQIPGQLYFFMIGIWLSFVEKEPYFISYLRKFGWLGFILFFIDLGNIFNGLLLGSIIFFIALAVPPIKYKFINEDISYGVYICHFPVIQTLIMYGVFAYSAWLGLAISFITTTILGIILWLAVEKKWISKRYSSVP